MLAGSNINLRMYREADLDEFFALRADYAERGDFEDTNPLPEAEQRKQFTENGWWSGEISRMAVTTKEDRLLGGIGFFHGLPIESGLEIGYAILKRTDRGRGFMTEALRIFSAYLFELKPIPRLQIRTAIGNLAARRVAEKCGYHLEGVQRQICFARGEYQDCALYSLLRAECSSLNEALRG